MATQKARDQSHRLSLVLAVLVLLFFIAIGVVFGYYRLSARLKPQFDPSSPGTRVSENKEAGFTFSYPKGFRYEKDRGIDSTPVNAKSSGTLILEDWNQSTSYAIAFTVASHRADAGILWMLNRYPRRETLSVAGENVIGYIEQNNDPIGTEHYEDIVVIPVNGLDYFVQYISDHNFPGTGDKYLDVFHQIIATMKFSPSTSRMLNQEFPSPTIPSLPSFGK